jgi:hypothetical protein
MGAASEGGYLGSDVEAFFSAVVSGAAGVYVGVLLQDAGIATDLVVRPGQRVSVSGDPSLPRPPRWGGGGFTVQQRGSLTLQSVALSSGLSVTNGGSAVLMACGGQLTSLSVTDSSFSASTTALGGSISLSNAGSVTLEDTTFAEGTELSVGGGTSLSLLSCRGQLTSLTVTDSSFSASTTTLGGGSISLINAGSVTLEDTTFAEGTELTVDGGTSLSLLSCGGQLTSLSVTDSSFSMDAASSATLGGGSISLSNAGSVTLEDTTFAEGTELTVGGGTSLSLSHMDVPADQLLLLLHPANASSAVRLSEVTVTTADGTQWPQLQPGTLVASTDSDGGFTLDPPADSFFDWFFPVRPLAIVAQRELQSTSHKI